MVVLSQDVRDYLDRLSDEEKYAAIKYLADEAHPKIKRCSDQATAAALQDLSDVERDAIESFLSTSCRNRLAYVFTKFHDEGMNPSVARQYCSHAKRRAPNFP